MQIFQYRNLDDFNGKGLTVGIVQSRFNENITNALTLACQQKLIECQVKEKNIVHVIVPGALEIPTVLQTLAKQNKFDVLIAIGCVIRGETYHFDLVAKESASGVSRVALDFGIPIINSIITTENIEQAIVRKNEKGIDSAYAAIEMANLKKALIKSEKPEKTENKK